MPSSLWPPPAVTSDLIQDVVQRIVARFAPEKVILLGSHAWGHPRPDSDVDLLVVMESDERPAKRSAKVSMACRPRLLAMDILVRTPAELAERLAVNDPFMRHITEEGQVLYER